MSNHSSARSVCALAVAASTFLSPPATRAANVFNLPPGQTSLQFVTVGDPGNAGDPLIANDDRIGIGAVASTYLMGKFEITAAQYAVFLNAVARTDTFGLYNSGMAPGSFAACGIIQGGNSGTYSYTVTAGHENFPVNYVSWGDAARFANWLTNGQPTGPQTNATTENGSYFMNGAISNSALINVTRKATALYVLPSENEWYKAAYYKGGSTNAGYWLYPTQSNSIPSSILSTTNPNDANWYNNNYLDSINYLTPVGAFAASPGPYGTFDQAGNAGEWDEAMLPEPNGSARGLRGGVFDAPDRFMRANHDSFVSQPSERFDETGFRIAVVPEPGSLSLIALAATWLTQTRRTSRKHRIT